MNQETKILTKKLTIEYIDSMHVETYDKSTSNSIVSIQFDKDAILLDSETEEESITTIIPLFNVRKIKIYKQKQNKTTSNPTTAINPTYKQKEHEEYNE